MFRLVKVTGESLSPSFREGDYVVITTLPFIKRKIRRGDVVVFRHTDYGTMIKKVEHIAREQDEVYVIGVHEDSVDSKRFGPISGKSMIGKVIWHIQNTH